MTDDDRVFKALADPTRRRLLDRLFAKDGRTLTDLESDVDMTRFGVMKHLRSLEEAGLITTRRVGREKQHFLNAVPIGLVRDRWIDKYTGPRVSALAALKTVRVHRVYLKATPERIWAAIVDPAFTRRYGYRAAVSYDLRPGGEFRAYGGADGPGPAECLVEGEVIESDPPRRLAQTWRPTWTDEPFTTLTYEIAPARDGVCSLTLTHDVHDAPMTAAQTAGRVEGAGGGWPEVLSDMKSLLETGTGMYA